MARSDGQSVKSWIAIAILIAVVVLGFGAWWTFGLDRGGDIAEMTRDVPRFPPVAAYYNGGRVFFAHTETSDPKISGILTDMMGSPVVTAHALARTPEQALGPKAPADHSASSPTSSTAPPKIRATPRSAGSFN